MPSSRLYQLYELHLKTLIQFYRLDVNSNIKAALTASAPKLWMANFGWLVWDLLHKNRQSKIRVQSSVRWYK